MKHRLLFLLVFAGCLEKLPGNGVWVSADRDQDVTATVTIRTRDPSIVPVLMIPMPVPYVVVKEIPAPLAEKPEPLK